MKKIWVLIILFNLLNQVESFPCDFGPSSFCENINQYNPNYYIFNGQIIDTFQNGVLFKIIEVLRGEEQRDTIIIWDDKPFQCNGPWFRLAHMLGAIGDTLVVALPQIDLLENEWEELNDYRTPWIFAYRSSLQLRNGVLEGYIAGTFGRDPKIITKFDYELFKMIAIQQRDCPTLLSTNTHDFPFESTFQVHPNPFDNQLFVGFPNANFPRLKYVITNMNGQILQQGILLQNQVIETNDLPKGMYVMFIKNEEGVIFSRRKLIKVRI